MKMKFNNLALLIAPVIFVSACSDAQVDRMKWIGKEPPMTEVQNPKEVSGDVEWPVRKDAPTQASSVNSLWSPSSRAFFIDQRARHVGDILTVNVEIKDNAKLDNKTERKRDASEDVGAPSLFGLQNKLVGWLPGKADPASLVDVSSASDTSGEGKIDRKEDIKTSVAAVITQVLPNGNMVIYGSQEVRVNYEARQLTVEGVVRPGDIAPSNEVDLKRVAEARVSYGGKGVISEIQQPRVGNQIIDILSPW